MKSKIEWTDYSWNCLRGCSRVSEGCRNCYAEKLAKRFSGPNLAYEGLIAKSGQWNGNIKFIEEKIDEPIRLKIPRNIFVNSMSDLFHENVEWKNISKIFTVMSLCPQHNFQVLTKRPENMLDFICHSNVFLDIQRIADEKYNIKHIELSWPLPNVWLGVSVENQQTANERIPLLLKTPAAVRFVSAEPLLGPVTLFEYDDDAGALRGPGVVISGGINPSTPYSPPETYDDSYSGIDWVIVGGESGKNARPMHPDWARSLRDQCAAAGTKFFFKQWGEFAEADAANIDAAKENRFIQRDGVDSTNWTIDRHDLDYTAHMVRVGKKAAGRFIDGRTWNQYPDI